MPLCCRFVSGVLLLSTCGLSPASPWPGGEDAAIDIDGAASNLSGATWNPATETLWVVRQEGQLWEYAYDDPGATFQLVRSVGLPDSVGSDIEACMQINQLAANELYVLDENTGTVSRVVDIGGSPLALRSWNLSTPNSGYVMPGEQGGAGPEAIEFVPDASLLAAGFRFPSGDEFAGSVKGAGGLIFVGHQIEGLLHVFDVNPDVSGDFINHGSFETAADEVAGLHFDRESGLMYIWHNPSNINSLEIWALASEAGVIETVELYNSAMPEGNIEGIAVVGRGGCGRLGAGGEQQVVFLTCDGGAPNLAAYSDFPCAAVGACCVASGCHALSEDACGQLGGLWLGGGASCGGCPPPGCPADLDVDGDIGVEDLLMMLESWGPCV
ncbi:MAG: hypothetical protein QF733_09875 [Phycisphaerales bacterium]|jgi:hypothetical protein|nr:hypothetical protein [Phycisphaerales bacterium]